MIKYYFSILIGFCFCYLYKSSLVNAALAAKDETIRAKDEIIASLRETIESLKRENEMLHQQLNRHQAEEMIKRHPFPTAVADEQKTRI